MASLMIFSISSIVWPHPDNHQKSPSTFISPKCI
jgi:hypothetical protein